MDLEILPPIDDWVFKLLFGDERNKSILIKLLSSFMELPDEEYELTFLNTHLKPETEDDKLGILDVKVQTKSGKIIDIEIQLNPVKNIGKRLSFYKSKMIVEQIGKTELYNVIEKVMCICILNYKLFPGVKEYVNDFKFCNSKNGLCFEEMPEELYTIELPKAPLMDDGSEVWDWVQFLRAKSKEEFEMLAVKNAEVREAVDTLYEISADELVRAEYEMRQKAWRDRMSQIDGYYHDGLEEGRKEGKLDGKLEVAAAMKKNGIPDDQITLYTGISPDKIAKL
jgi:predicted transposase/invertase (TIGR01784 family)